MVLESMVQLYVPGLTARTDAEPPITNRLKFVGSVSPRDTLAAGSGLRLCRAVPSVFDSTTRAAKMALGILRRESLIPIDDRQSGHACEPVAEGPSLFCLSSLVAAHVHWQANDKTDHLLGSNEFAKVIRVSRGVAALIDRQRRGDYPLGVADRQANANAAVIHAEQPPLRRHR